MISSIENLKKEREENNSSKKELMTQKESVQGSKNLRSQLEKAIRIEETLVSKEMFRSQHSITKGSIRKERKYTNGSSQGKNQ
jgi:hypothetical protein